MEFKPFSKIPRLTRDCVITEKLDGTNGLIFISEDLSIIKAGSRKRWITPDDDNYSFADWVNKHSIELISELGPGYHYGEWWGYKIQRGYDIKERKFSLFNVHRWAKNKPTCCDVVPILYSGPFYTNVIDSVLDKLKETGSVASPGFMRPEGVIIYHEAGKYLFKKTLEKDGQPKSTYIKGNSNGI